MTKQRHRLDALLVDEATHQLTDATRAELDKLLSEHKDVDRYAFERTASAVFAAVASEPNQKMPAALSARLITAGIQTLDAKG